MPPQASDFDMEMRAYVVEYPYVSNQPKQEPDGNPILYLGLFLATKRQFFPLDQNDKMIVHSCYALSMKEPGLISRSRFKFDDPEAHDDYIGLVHAGYFCGLDIPMDVYLYGRAHDWAYNNTKLRWFRAMRFWQWNFFGQIQHYKIASNVSLNLGDKILWWLAMAFVSRSESGIQIQWLMGDLYLNQPKKYWLCDKALNLWESKLSRDHRYPDKMGSVFAKCFGDTHILAKWMRGLIFRR